MPQVVQAEGLGTIEFPDDASQDEIIETVNRLDMDRQGPVASTAQSFLRSGTSGIGAALKGLATSFHTMDPKMISGPLPPLTSTNLMSVPGAKTPGQVMSDIQRDPTFIAGQALQDVAPEAHPVAPSREGSALTGFAGSMGSFAPLVASGPLAPVTIGLQSAGDHITADYESGKQAGLSDDAAAELAMRKAQASGTLQAGIFAALPSVMRNVAEKYLVNTLGKAGFARWLTGRAAAGVEGAALGGASQAGENVIEGRPAGEGVGPAAGGMAAMNVLLPWLRAKGAAPEVPPMPEPGRAPEPPPMPQPGPAPAATPPMPEPVRPIEVTKPAIDELLAAMRQNQIQARKPGETIEVSPNEQVPIPETVPQPAQGPEPERPEIPAPEEPQAQPAPAPGDARGNAEDVPEVGAQPTPELEAAPAPTETTVSKLRRRKLRADEDRPPDIIDDLEEVGKISLASARELDPDWRPPNAARKLFGADGMDISDAAEALRRSGKNIPKDDHLLDMVDAAADSRKANRRAFYGEERLANEQEQQAHTFWKAAADPKSTSGLQKVNVQDLKVGDTFRLRAPGVSHEELTVTHVDPDTGHVTVKDGSSFGVQDLPDGTEIWVKKGSVKEAVPEAHIEPEQAPAAEPFQLNQPESVEDQKARMAQEEAQAAKKAQADKMAELAAKPLVGSRGDIGQGNLIEPPESELRLSAGIDPTAAVALAKKAVDYAAERASEMPERLKSVWDYAVKTKRKIDVMRAASPNKDLISATKDAADSLATVVSKQASNTIRHDLNRAFGADVNERNELRENALTMVLESGAGVEHRPGQQILFPRGQDARWNLVEMRANILGSEFAGSIWGKKALAAIDFANRNWETIVPIARDYAALTDAQNAAENAAGYKTLYRQGGYVFHLQDVNDGIDFPDAVAGYSKEPQNAPAPFRHIRDYQTYADSIAAGLKPKSLNAVDLLQRRLNLGQRLINYGGWMDSLRRVVDPTTKGPLVTEPDFRIRADGTPDVRAPIGYFLTDFGGQTVAVHNGYSGVFGDLTQGSWVRGGEGRRMLVTAAATAKHSMLLFDTFHLGRLAYWNAITRGGAPTYDRGLTLLDNTDAELHKMAERGEIPAEWLDKLQDDRRKLNSMLRAGLNVGNVGDNLHTELVQKIPGLGHFNKWLFESYQRGAMSEVALIEYNRVKRQFPNLSDAEVARKVAKAVNIRFGNLNSQAWIKSKTGQDLARLCFLAPQWNESLIRAELGAMRDIGMAPVESVRQRRLVMGTLGRAMGTALLGQFMANQLINYGTRGKPTWENEEEDPGAKISAYIPDYIGKGPGFFWNPAAIPAEITHLLIKATDRAGGDFSKALLAFGSSRLNNLSRPFYTLITRKDAGGRSLRSGTDVAKEMASSAAPLPISGSAFARAGKQMITGQHEEAFPGQFQKQAMQSLGIKTDAAPSAEQRIGALARKFNASKGILPDADFYAGDYENFVKALRLGNTRDAKSELDDLLTKKTAEQVYKHFSTWTAHPFTGQRASREGQFMRTLNPEQQQTYQKAKDSRLAVSKEAVALLRVKVGQ